MSLSNHTLDSAAYSTGANSIGLGYPQSPVIDTNYIPGQTFDIDTYNFNVRKVENGWTITIGARQWICQTPQELADRMVTILVQERLEK